MLEIDFRDPCVIADPYPLLHQLREQDPCHWNEGLGAWCWTRYADVAMGLRDARFSADRIRPFVEHQTSVPRELAQTLGDTLSLWLVFNDPPTHTRLRKLLNRGFTPAAINTLREDIRAIVNELIDGVVDRHRMDVVADFGYPLPATVIGEMLGVPRSDMALLKRWSDDIAAFVLVSRTHSDKYAAAAGSIAEMNAYFADLIVHRRRKPGNKVIDGLIAAHEDQDALTVEELIASCSLLLFAGHETTTHFICNGLLGLIRNPEQLEDFRRNCPDEGYRHIALSEILRWDGPIISVMRVPAEELTAHGRILKKGDRVYLFVNAADRDPREFSDPDKLDLRRESARRQLAFGHGIHTCLGAHLARVEGAVAFPLLLSRLNDFTLETDTLVWSDSLVIRGLESLPIGFRPAR
jgi:cytochrome P450